MATSLQPLGTASYNGVAFNVYTDSTVAVRPVYDQAQRTVTHNAYTFTFRTLLYGSPTDPQVVAARQALTKPGGQFLYKDRGLGDISCNNGTVRDVAWGPKPRELSFRYLGRDQACEMVFSLEVAIPDCSGARYAFAPMEFNYKVTYDVDRSGWTKLVYAGFVRVPITRRGVGDRAVIDSADAYREKIFPQQIEGFRRIAGPFELSEDRRTLTFSVTYERMGANAPPPGVVDVKASYKLNSSQVALVKWFATLSAEYEMAADAPRGAAASHFWRDLWPFYRAKIEAQAKGAVQGAAAFPVSVSVEEPEIYGRPRANFSVTVWFLSDLPSVLKDSGLWEPVPNSDWRKWSASMRGVLGPRGVDGIQFSLADDRVLDLCDVRGALPKPVTRNPELRGNVPAFADFQCPPAAQSWLDYRCWVEVEADQGTAELRSVPTDQLTPAPPAAAGNAELRSGGPKLGDIINPGPGTPGGRMINDPIPPSQNPPDVVIDQRAAPMCVVYLCGWAMRACHSIPVPQLTLVNGVVPKASNRLDRGEGFRGPVVCANFGVPILYARWRQRYVLPSIPPGGVPVPANPLLGA